MQLFRRTIASLEDLHHKVNHDWLLNSQIFFELLGNPWSGNPFNQIELVELGPVEGVGSNVCLSIGEEGD